MAQTARALNPERHVEKKAKTFDVLAIEFIWNLPFDDEFSVRQFQYMAASSISWMTGHRMQDLNNLLSNCWSLLSPTATKPRAIKLKIVIGGKDPHAKKGSGELERTNIVPCLCLIISKDETAKRVFARSLVTNANIKCITGCPYMHVLNYLDQLEDAKGEIQDALIEKEEKKGNHTQKPLKFFRQQSTNRNMADKHFTLGPVGNGILVESFKYLNGRLPTHLQCEDPTGHSGRRSFITNAKKGRASDLCVSASSHHALKSKSIVSYVDGDARTISTEGALAIGNLIVEERNDSDMTHKVGGFVMSTVEEIVQPAELTVETVVDLMASAKKLAKKVVEASAEEDEESEDESDDEKEKLKPKKKKSKSSIVFNFNIHGAGNVNVTN